MEKPSSGPLDSAKIEKASDTWPNFTNNFLYKFFEGRSFSIWFLVSGAFVILYGRYASFDESWMGASLKYFSFDLLLLLIVWTFIKNLINVNPWDLGYKIRLKFNMLSFSYRLPHWTATVLGSESTKLDLPLRIVNFKRVYSRARVIDAGDGRWRAGFVFNSLDGKKEYIFHTYQDKGQSAFRVRIVERIPWVKEIPNDINKQIGVINPRDFNFWVEVNNGYLEFYIDNIFVGKYKVPLNKIGNIQVVAWSDKEPIKIIFKDIELKA